MKSITSLAGELEAVCQRIQREPLAGERIRLAGHAQWLSHQMQDAIPAECLIALRSTRPALPIKRSGFFGVAADICDIRPTREVFP